ncbi:hypothetical protein [Streptomyces mutabilis]|uniref:hypothetical protein n=1 Tax=Streptomyces mutabilis TaxID=67332 RepID=UPI0034DE8A2B
MNHHAEDITSVKLGPGLPAVWSADSLAAVMTRACSSRAFVALIVAAAPTVVLVRPEPTTPAVVRSAE